MAGLRLGELLHRLAAFLRLRQQAGGSGDQQLAAELQFVRTMAVGQITVMPNALEAGRKSMNEKAPLKLIGPQCHASGFLAVLAAVVLPLKRNLMVFER